MFKAIWLMVITWGTLFLHIGLRIAVWSGVVYSIIYLSIGQSVLFLLLGFLFDKFTCSITLGLNKKIITPMVEKYKEKGGRK